MDSVLKDNDELRSEVGELQTRLENGDRVMQGLQSGREEAERWAIYPLHPFQACWTLRLTCTMEFFGYEVKRV